MLGDPLNFYPFLRASRGWTICKAEMMGTPRSKYAEFTSLATSPGSPWWLLTQMLSEETSKIFPESFNHPLKAHVSLYRLKKKNSTPDRPCVLLWNTNNFADHHHQTGPLYNHIRTQTKTWALSKLQKWLRIPPMLTNMSAAASLLFTPYTCLVPPAL